MNETLIWGLAAGGFWLALCTFGEVFFGDGPAAAASEPSEPTLELVTDALGGSLKPIADHTGLTGYNPATQGWRTWHLLSSSDESNVQIEDGRYDYARVGSGPTRIIAQWRGERAAAMMLCLEREAPRYEHRSAYQAWPGPNSNTFIDTMLRRCDIPYSLPSTAIGKDYRGLIGASWTSEGTGFQLETPILGLRLGLFEGIQLHLIGLSLGLDLWPPAIILPWGEGRFGFHDR